MALDFSLPLESLECCCCGNGTKGRQWWNRDTGYGLCDDCIEYVGADDVKVGNVADAYGVRGYHWDTSKTANEIPQQAESGDLPADNSGD